MRISAVIPTLDEAARIAGCVRAVRALEGEWEVIVADGGSRDETPALARAAGADAVLAAPCGRGSQLRAGAAAATGAALLFLHADARLPASAARLVAETLADPACSGGAFRVRHGAEGTRHGLARVLLPLADLRSRYTRLPYGDQALFTTRARYEAVGGFPEQPLMEDLEFARRLRREACIRRVPAVVRVSGRRFQARPIRTFLCWSLFPPLYALGVSAERLARWYGLPADAAQ